MSSDRWPRAQVIALAPRAAVWTAALPLVDPGAWWGLGCDDSAVWGRFRGTAAEPYDVVAHHRALRSRCSCPSSLRPCKHVLALLALWSDDVVPGCSDDRVPTAVREWCATIALPDSSIPPRIASHREQPEPLAGSVGPAEVPPEPVDGSEHRVPERLRPERVLRMQGGLDDLVRWIDDAVRSGLARPEFRQWEPYEAVAARLVDAQLGGLANRVRRLAHSVSGIAHDDLLEEIAVWHLLASAGLERDAVDDDLRDAVDVALGWQVRQTDVLAGPAETDEWMVMGRSDHREDRIDVRRTWLRGCRSGRWAVLLSFAATDGGLDDSYTVGTTWPADLHRYPGRGATRALVGRVHGPVGLVEGPPSGDSLDAACRSVGVAVAAEPWVERVPVHVRTSVGRIGDRWALTDPSGSLLLAPEAGSVTGVGVLLSCAAGGPVDLTAEWTPRGMIPLAIHLPDRVVEVGPTTSRSTSVRMGR